MKGKYPPYDAEPITDVRDLFLKSTERFADRIALQHKKDGRWVPITYRELRESVESVACALAALGLRPQENKVAIVSENRPEWAIAYLAAACTGIVLVPIDKELRETEVYHILYLSGADALRGPPHMGIRRPICARTLSDPRFPTRFTRLCRTLRP